MIKTLPGRPTKAELTKRKERILDQAIDDFCAVGYFETSPLNIARKSGSNSRLISKLYANKEGLFRSTISKMLADIPALKINVDLIKIDRAASLRNLVAKVREYITDDRYMALCKLIIAESLRFPAITARTLDQLDLIVRNGIFEAICIIENRDDIYENSSNYKSRLLCDLITGISWGIIGKRDYEEDSIQKEDRMNLIVLYLDRL